MLDLGTSGWSDRLERASPASRDTDPAAFGQMLYELGSEGVELHSMMVWRAGAVIAEGFAPPYAPDRPHMVHSVTKSFTSMAVGLSIDAGLLSLDDPVAQFFPEAARLSPSPENLSAMQVRHLLTMTAGHARGISGGLWRQMSTSWVENFFRQPVPHRPGEVFVYNSAASHILAVIVQKLTGQTLPDYLDEPVFQPLGLSPHMTWETDPEGYSSGGNGLSCTTSDMLKLGILHLQGGAWKGRQLLPADWVRAATDYQQRDIRIGVFTGTAYLGPDEVQGEATARRREGYGFQWWRGPHNSFSANGLFGQYCFVLPEQEAVVAFTGGLDDADLRVHEKIWRLLLPALGTGVPSQVSHSLPFVIPVSLSGRTPPAEVAGQRLDFAMVPGEWELTGVSIEPGPQSCRIELTDGKGLHVIEAGLGHWIAGRTTLGGEGLHHAYEAESMEVNAGCRWASASELVVELLFPGTAFRDTLTFRFGADRIEMQRAVNVDGSRVIISQGKPVPQPALPEGRLA